MASFLNQILPHLCRKTLVPEGFFRQYSGINKLRWITRAAAAEFSSFHTKESKCGAPLGAMRDTFKEVIIPIKSDLTLRERYSLNERAAICASILKDMSVFAESICYSHNQNLSVESPCVPIHIFPKNMEKLELGHISCLHDLILTGMVTWTGQEFMETTLELYQDIGGYREPCLSARMLLEARDPSTGKPVMVNTIVPERKDEEKRFQQAQYRQDQIRKKATNVPRRLYPLMGKQARNGPNLKDNTEISSSQIIEPSRNEQENTVLKTIPSGFQMEKAVEMAFETANKFTEHRENSMMVYLDYIDMHRPVNVHSSWKLTCQVVYTRKQCFQVAVTVEELDKCNTDKEPVSNFLFTFKSSLPDLPVVIPRRMTMEMRHLDYKMQELTF
ncbi:hypothetical protein ACJMK2_017521 [Sinanodonta woodiana]|uniref:HotDog ACOT-type domain-containing protein n=1 Tax=Sinanodonta woodiana TaxID=1069815 RepID=A0ABD3UAL3_SINWO